MIYVEGKIKVPGILNEIKASPYKLHSAMHINVGSSIQKVCMAERLPNLSPYNLSCLQQS